MFGSYTILVVLLYEMCPFTDLMNECKILVIIKCNRLSANKYFCLITKILTIFDLVYTIIKCILLKIGSETRIISHHGDDGRKC